MMNSEQLTPTGLSPPAEKYISIAALAERLGVHRVTIWRMVKSRQLPKLVQLTPGKSAFLRAEIEDWERQRIEDRDRGQRHAAFVENFKLPQEPKPEEAPPDT